MKKVALIVLDGWGVGENKENNAIYMAKPKFFNHLITNYPNTKLQASGELVGLPKGQIGGSEVGHLTMGAGRVLEESLTKINNTFSNLSSNNTILQIPTFQQFIKNAQQRPAHLVGLISTSGVHAHIQHLFSLLKVMKQQKCLSPNIHFISDGRDTSTQSGIVFAQQLLQLINLLNYGKVVSLSGRFFAMDRDNNLDRTKKAVLNILRESKPVQTYKLIRAFENSYQQKITDEFIEPVIVDQYYFGVNNDEPFFFFNFRADRMRQLITMLKQKLPNNPFFTITRYDDNYSYKVIFDKEKVDVTLGKIISDHKLSQLRAAETEKAPHVTYFFNGGTNIVYKGEHRIICSSNKIKHDVMPEMKAKKITDNIINFVTKKHPDFILANYANSDMVGHTGNFPAIITAIQTLDHELERLCSKLIKNKYICVITADHGNSDIAYNPITKEINTAHTLNPVPFIIYSPDNKYQLKPTTTISFGLSDIAGTVLDLMEIEKPKENFNSMLK